MTQSIATFAQLAAGLVIWGSYALALVDWGRSERRELRPGRRAGWIWGAGALGLALVIGALQGLAFGWVRMWEFLTGDGRMLLLQALGLVILVESGQSWAARCGGTPLRPAGRRWRRWPWGWLAGALAGMLGWTLLVAWLVPHHDSTNVLHLLGLEGMDPWLQLPTAIALLTLAPILEECLFRHYLLYRVAAWLSGGRDARPWIGNAIVVTSLLWSVAHIGQIEQIWVKWVQVFVPGLVLGWTAWRHGLERAIALHWAFNLCLLGLMLARSKILYVAAK